MTIHTSRTTVETASHHALPTGNSPAIEPATVAYAIGSTPRSGRGVFAARRIAQGERIAITRPEYIGDYRTRTSIEVRPGRHAELSFPAAVINHGCVPNLGIRDNAYGGFDYFALRKIDDGEQLRVHYGMHEWRSIAVHRCRCGSSGCQGRAKGFAELSPDDRDTLTALGAARHLTHADPVAPPRGLHATICISGIAADDVPGHDIAGRNRVRMFLDQLVRVIGMNPHGEPQMDYYPADDSPRSGWTAVQFIDTSSVTSHHYRGGSAWVDITSCLPFHVATAADWCQRHLKGKGQSEGVMELI